MCRATCFVPCAVGRLVLPHCRGWQEPAKATVVVLLLLVVVAVVAVAAAAAAAATALAFSRIPTRRA